MREIRVAIIGVGNCCSALLQGVHYYASNRSDSSGILHWNVGGYLPSDLKFVAAFDIDSRKVGRDLSRSIFSEPNTVPHITDVPELSVPVLRGPTLDSLGQYTKELVLPSKEEPVDIKRSLLAKRAEIVVNLLPGGASEASRFYAEQALEAGCGFVNATPTPIVSDPEFAERFKKHSVPGVGDDLMDQIGATVLHIGVLKLLEERGVHIDESYQLDVGGGAESLSTLEKGKEAKRKIKTEMVATSVPYAFPLVAGSTDYVDFLGNQRNSLFWIKGSYFCGMPVTLDIRLETSDGPNAGAILFDVIRAVKLAMDRKITGPLEPVSAYAFKMPPRKIDLREAVKEFEEFIAEK